MELYCKIFPSITETERGTKSFPVSRLLINLRFFRLYKAELLVSAPNSKTVSSKWNSVTIPQSHKETNHPEAKKESHFVPIIEKEGSNEDVRNEIAGLDESYMQKHLFVFEGIHKGKYLGESMRNVLHNEYLRWMIGTQELGNKRIEGSSNFQLSSSKESVHRCSIS